MLLGIKAYVDFAFKKLFGSPENSVALIGLLNAILDLPEPISEVTILNPFSYLEFESAKQVLLDVKARDSAGRFFNVEMQVLQHPSLLQRLVYYASEMYTSQLNQGDDYLRLTTTISICLVTRNLFPETKQAHHRFQLIDPQSGRKIDRAIEIHTIELKKFDCDSKEILKASNLAKWAWLILKAHDYRADELRQMFPATPFQRLISCLESISSITRDKAMHDQREKAQRDYDWMIAAARSEAREEGLAAGRSEGRQEGREEGREEGLQIGAIRSLQQIFGEPVSELSELIGLPLAELQAKVTDLQAKIRSRRT